MRRSPVWFLQRLPMFVSLSDAHLQRICARSRYERHPSRAKVLFNDAGNTAFLLLEGSAKLIRQGLLGRRVVETILDTGDLFGSVSGSAGPNSFVLETLSPIELLHIPADTIGHLVRERPEFAMVVIQSLEDRQRRLQRNVESLLFKDLTSRVIDAILWLAKEHGDRCEHGWAVDIRISQQDLADLCGATRQAVSGILGKLERRFLLRRTGRVICILSMRRLKNYAAVADDTPK
jgi:CRP/FNR family transcriptional regulator, cyclic AMP receptor protein